ncbi:MAG: ABC transporter permease [Bacteroidetes bacterium]|nr:MAG: ABC transporter permease [Bacteroidota bacterium]
MTTTLSSSLTVFLKDFKSEIRTRYALNALLMFVVTTISIILFALGNENASTDILCGVLWVIIFFSSMAGLSRTFVSEEERGTVMTLQLIASPMTVYIGKLLFNLALLTMLNVVTVVLYSIVIPNFIIQTYSIFILTIFFGILGFAGASTILAALIAKAGSKGTLYPVLAFPILLPLLMTVINATKMAVEGEPFTQSLEMFQILLAYVIVIMTLPFLLFEYVWRE